MTNHGQVVKLKPENIYPRGIFEKRFVELNGKKIGMILKGKDLRNPILLMMSGGPALPEYLLEYFYPSQLDQDYTLCYYSYYGTGLSYQPGIRKKDLTSSAYLEDALAVTKYLRETFESERLFLLGHSFGSYLALMLASDYPENYVGYIAMSQVTDQLKSEEIAFSWMRDQYQEMGKQAIVKKFDSYLNETGSMDIDRYLVSSLRDKAMHQLGVGTTRKMQSVINDIFLASFSLRDFTWRERLNIWRGKLDYRSSPVIATSFNFSAFKTVQTLEIPICFLVGRYDLTCNASLQEAYYEFLQAKNKKIYLFDESAHSPIFEEQTKAIEIMATIKKEWQN